jgi:hypothetical protein
MGRLGKQQGGLHPVSRPGVRRIYERVREDCGGARRLAERGRQPVRVTALVAGSGATMVGCPRSVAVRGAYREREEPRGCRRGAGAGPVEHSTLPWGTHFTSYKRGARRRGVCIRVWLVEGVFGLQADGVGGAVEAPTGCSTWPDAEAPAVARLFAPAGVAKRLSRA